MKAPATPFIDRSRAGGAFAALLLVLGLMASPAAADELISVDSDGVLFAAAGTRTNIAEESVDPAKVGQICSMKVLSQNQSSIHAGNDLVITTGGVETVIADVEAVPDASIDLSVELILGETISVDLRMGQDGVSSFGFDLSLECASDDKVLSKNTVNCSDDSGSDTGTTTTTTVAGTSEDCPTDPVVEPVTDPIVEPDPDPVTTTPPTEFGLPPAPPVSAPVQCPDDTTGNLTVIPESCPEPVAPAPTPTVPVAEPTTTTAPPPVVKPATTPTTVADTSDDPEPEVLGIQVTSGLPSSPAAFAIPGFPKYNG